MRTAGLPVRLLLLPGVGWRRGWVYKCVVATRDTRTRANGGGVGWWFARVCGWCGRAPLVFRARGAPAPAGGPLQQPLVVELVEEVHRDQPHLRLRGVRPHSGRAARRSFMRFNGCGGQVMVPASGGKCVAGGGAALDFSWRSRIWLSTIRSSPESAPSPRRRSWRECSPRSSRTPCGSRPPGTRCSRSWCSAASAAPG